MKSLVGLFVVACSVLWVGTANSKNSSKDLIDQTIRIRLESEPATLDWNLAHTTSETYLLNNLMEGLVEVGSDLTPRLALATRWNRSDDGKTYTFDIRKGVKWSDGVPLVANHFVEGWKRLLSPLTASSYAYLLFDVEGAEAYHRGKLRDFSKVGVSAPDKHKLVVRLKEPVAHWIYIPTFWPTFPIRKDLVRKYGQAWVRPGRMATLGPFTLDLYEQGSRFVLGPNPNYYRSRGNVAKVEFVLIEDDKRALKLYNEGKLDFFPGIGTVDISKHRDLKSFPYLKTSYIGFNVNKYPFNRKEVRQAVAMAIDKNAIVQTLTRKLATATTFVPPQLRGFRADVTIPYNPTKAKRMLKAAGVTKLRSLKVDYILPSWDVQLRIANSIKEQLKKNLGLQVSLQPFTHQKFRAQVGLHAYPMFSGYWGADYPDADNFLSVFLSKAGTNRTLWSNKDYDALVLKARSTRDSQRRTQFYDLAQKILIQEDAVIVPLFYETNTALVKSHIKGIQLTPLNYLFLRDVNVRPQRLPATIE